MLVVFDIKTGNFESLKVLKKMKVRIKNKF